MPGRGAVNSMPKDTGTYVYMKVTDDEYELPLCVADTVMELAELTGSTRNAIYTAVNKQKRGKLKKSQWRKVLIEEDG